MFHVFLSENCAVHEIMWQSKVQTDRPQMTIWRMRFVCRITKATNAHSEYVIIIVFHYNITLTCLTLTFILTLLV